MFRRIELINHFPQGDDDLRYFKSGLCGVSTDAVANAWTELHVPRKPVNKNVRYFFTELGWKKYGRPTVDACIQTGQGYRVIAVEEHVMDVLYRDEYQVCLRPKRRVKRDVKRHRRRFE